MCRELTSQVKPWASQAGFGPTDARSELRSLPLGPFARSDVSGVQVLWGRPCLVLEPARAFAFGQGARAPTLGGVRPWYRQSERVVREWNLPQHQKKAIVAIGSTKCCPFFPGALWAEAAKEHFWAGVKEHFLARRRGDPAVSLLLSVAAVRLLDVCAGAPHQQNFEKC